ncbi:hypothetical protein F0562_023311 [Nyssa sinensis]|uniref:Amino acid transporter transmembrane domain-containing protein n=1 Tax=Nyssa sinensis TaxID=561372 RepID=A0A5J5BHG4_9ASTE|nr:hypothetical protein F0562_023311 [Nyssa sinensis]
MASSAFKSTTKRTPIGTPSNADDSVSSNRNHRRSRSLSRFSRQLAEPEVDFQDVPAPRGRFVNTTRGSGFPEISLDDLAVEFFPLKDLVADRESERRGLSRRGSEIGPPTAATKSSQRRGRSVSRQSSRVGDGKSTFSSGSGGGKVASDANSRRRRSVSVVRCQISDSESDIDHSRNSSSHANTKSFNGGISHIPSLEKPTAFSHRRLGRSLSLKDLPKLHDRYSSQSSALTDDEVRDARSSKNTIERTIRAVYAQKKAEHPTGNDVNSGLYEAMRKELRHAVDEIRMEIEQTVMRKTSPLASGECLEADNSDNLQAVSAIRKNYATKLEQSEQRKQDLLAQIVLEEQRGRELSKIVRELLPDPKSSAVADKPSQVRKRSNGGNKMSKRLTEEAEKYFEDFISNVEDTDFSSFDGERSDASSSLGGITKPRESVVHCVETENYQSPATSNSLPVEMDGVVLPWLQWETSNDRSLLCKNKRLPAVTPKVILWDAAQEGISTQDPSSHSTSSRGSWSPGLADGHLINTREDAASTSKECGSYQRSQFDTDRNAKWWYSAFHNVTAMVGAGVLGLPYAMSQLGWGPGITILILSWVITLYTLWQMVEMHEIVPGKRFDRYHELGQHAFGEKLGLWVVVPQQLMVEVGVNIVYMVTGGKSLQKFHDLVCPSCKSIKTTYFIMIFGSVHFVLSHLPSFNSITAISLAAAIMSLSYSTIAWVASVSKGVQPDVQYSPRASTTTGSVFQFLSALGDVSFAYAGHNVVLEIQATIPSTPGKPSKKSMWKGVVVAYIVVALCYFPVSIIGYWVFGNTVQDNILISLEKPAWLIAVANMFVVVHVIGSYQIFAQPVFDMVEAWLVIKMNFKPSCLLRIVTRSLYVGLTMFIAITFPFFGGLLSFFGGFAFAPTSYFVSHSTRACYVRTDDAKCLNLPIYHFAASLYHMASHLQTQKVQLILVFKLDMHHSWSLIDDFSSYWCIEADHIAIKGL